MKLVFAACLVICLVCVGSARAEIIARFDFEGNDYTANAANLSGANTNLNLTSSVSVTGVTVGQLGFSPGLDATASLGFAADQFDNALGFSNDVNNDRSFISTNQAVFFRFDVEPGFTVDLESIQFDSLKTRGPQTEQGARVTYAVFVNPATDPAVTGLMTDFNFLSPSRSHTHFHDNDPPSSSGSRGASFSTGRLSVDPFDASAHQGLSGTNTIAIRLFSDEDPDSVLDQDRDFGIDNLVLTGTVTAIPEPSVFSALFASVCCLACRRRSAGRSRRLTIQ